MSGTSLRSVSQLLTEWETLRHATPMELAAVDPSFLVEAIVQLKRLHAASQKTTEPQPA